MVEVLKKNLPREKTRTISCKECKSRLRFKESEARYVADQRDGDALVIKCPVCKAENWISA